MWSGCSTGSAPSKRVPGLGIPYASHDFDPNGDRYVTCPVCHERVDLVERKDFESMTGIEYARHYEQKHKL